MTAGPAVPLFAIATFMRVFDVEPKRDVVTLDELTAGLTRFIVKPKLHRAIVRDVERIEKAYDAWCAGVVTGGRRYSYIARGGMDGGKDGATAARDRLLRKAKARAKTDLRLWSPALYQEDGRRDSDSVIHVSCLVLDFDSGVSIDEVSADWARWYHVIHTTWSHRPSHPKLRLAVPLAHPVHAADWRDVWEWAAERSELENDPALKSPASTFALPATRHPEAPRDARVHGGALLSPLAEGIVADGADPPPMLPPQEASHFRGTDPSERTIDQPRSEAHANIRDVPTSGFDLFGPPDRPAEPNWDDEFDDLF